MILKNIIRIILLLIGYQFFTTKSQSQPALPKKLQKELLNYVWVNPQVGNRPLLGTYLEPEPGSNSLDMRLPEHYEPLLDTFSFIGAFVAKTEITANQYFIFLRDSLKLAQNDSNAIKNLIPACTPTAFFQKFCFSESEKLIYNPDYQQYPVVCVNYSQVLAYCSWLSNRLKKLIAQEKNSSAIEISVRIPTDLEYEFLLNASKVTQDNCGAFPLDAGSCAQFTENDGFKFLNPVRAFPANGLGLFGLYGNVAEWTQDDLGEIIVRDIRAYRRFMNEQRDEAQLNIPTPVDDARNYEDIYNQFREIKVIKGAAYCTTPYRVKGASRGACAINEAKCWIGFRTIIEITENK